MEWMAVSKTTAKDGEVMDADKLEKVKAVVDDLHSFLSDNYCQCAYLPDNTDCYWHKLFNVGKGLQDAIAQLDDTKREKV